MPANDKPNAIADITKTVRHYRSIWRAVRLGTAYAIVNNAATIVILLANARGAQVMSDLPAANMNASAITGFAVSTATLLFAFTRAGSYRKAACVVALFFASLVVTAAAILIARGLRGQVPFDFRNVLVLQFVVWHMVAIAAVLAGFWSVGALARENPATTPLPGLAVAKTFSRQVTARRQSYSELNTTKYIIVPLAVIAFIALYWAAIAGIYAWNDELFPVLGDASMATSEEFAAIFKQHPTEAFMYNAIGILAIFSIFPIGLFVTRVARRIMQRRADALILSGRYAPIVFLRSFQDENVRVAPISYVRWVTRLFPRLEEVVLSTVAKMGPPIAIGLPGEKLRRLGAMRAYYDNDAWQPAFEDWVDRGHLIVAMAGTTPWALWELRYLLEHGLAAKLIVVFPTIADPRSRWNNMQTAIAGTPWETAWTVATPADVCALVFLPGGRLQLIKSSSNTQADYEFAVRAALVTQMEGPAQGPGTPHPEKYSAASIRTAGPVSPGVALIKS